MVYANMVMKLKLFYSSTFPHEAFQMHCAKKTKHIKINQANYSALSSPPFSITWAWGIVDLVTSSHVHNPTTYM